MVKKLFWATVTVALGAGAVVISILGLNFQKSELPAVTVARVSGTADTPQGKLPHALLEMAVYPNSQSGAHGPDGGKHPDWVSYGPTSNFQVPAHSLVTITLKQYDGGEKLRSPYFRNVVGTVDGSATWNGKLFKELKLENIGHTFTIHGLPTNQDEFFLNVPLPLVDEEILVAAEDKGEYPEPQVIVFSFITGGAGEYVWNCEFPCGDGTYGNFGDAMSSLGYMAGRFTVV